MLWRYLETTLEFAFLFVFVRCIFAGIASVTVNIMKLREPDCKLGSLFFDLLRVGTSFIKSASELITRGFFFFFFSVTVRGLCCLVFVFGITVLFFWMFMKKGTEMVRAYLAMQWGVCTTYLLLRIAWAHKGFVVAFDAYIAGIKICYFSWLGVENAVEFRVVSGTWLEPGTGNPTKRQLGK